MQKTELGFRQHICSYNDFPKPGVVYWDFTPILSQPPVFRRAIAAIVDHFKSRDISKIAAIEAKGFAFGAAVAYAMEKPMVLIRKPELIPGSVDSEKFEKEYGLGEYQLKSGTVDASDRVLVIYDIMAGSGATRAAINLLQRAGAMVDGAAFVIELEYLNGRADLREFEIFSLVKIPEATGDAI